MNTSGSGATAVSRPVGPCRHRPSRNRPPTRFETSSLVLFAIHCRDSRKYLRAFRHERTRWPDVACDIQQALADGEEAAAEGVPEDAGRREEGRPSGRGRVQLVNRKYAHCNCPGCPQELACQPRLLMHGTIRVSHKTKPSVPSPTAGFSMPAQDQPGSKALSTVLKLGCKWTI